MIDGYQQFLHLLAHLCIQEFPIGGLIESHHKHRLVLHAGMQLSPEVPPAPFPNRAPPVGQPQVSCRVKSLCGFLAQRLADIGMDQHLTSALVLTIWCLGAMGASIFPMKVVSYAIYIDMCVYCTPCLGGWTSLCQEIGVHRGFRISIHLVLLCLGLAEGFCKP